MKSEKRFWVVVLLAFVAILVWHITSAIVPALAKGMQALTPFLLAFITAYLLKHPVIWMEKFLRLISGKKQYRWQHTVACLVVLLAFFGAGIGLVGAMIPGLLNNISDFVTNLPEIIKSGMAFAQNTVDDLSQKLDEDTVEMIKIYATDIGNQMLDFVKSKMGTVVITITNIATKTAGALVDLVLYAVAAFMFLHGYDNIKRTLKRCVRLFVREQNKYEEACGFLHNCDVIIEKYIVVRLVTSIGIGIVSYIGFMLFGLEYSIILAVLIAVTNLIPYIGPFIGGAPVVLVALATKDLSTAIWVTVFMLVLQQLEGNVLTPLITSDALEVNPILVLIGIAVFGAMMGIPGMILGAPFAAIIAGLIKHALVIAEKKAEIKENIDENQ